MSDEIAAEVEEAFLIGKKNIILSLPGQQLFIDFEGMFQKVDIDLSFSTNAEKDTETAPTFHTPLKDVKEEAPDEDERHDTFAKDVPSSSENEHSSSSIGDDDILFQDLLVKQSAKCCANDIYERIKKRKHGSAT